MKTAIVWLEKDLRTDDNPALFHASKDFDKLVPVFIREKNPSNWEEGSASKWWLHHSLVSLSKKFKSLGSPLVLREGKFLDCLQQLAEEAGASAVYWNEDLRPRFQKLHIEIRNHLESKNLEVKAFEANLLFDPRSIANQQNKPYQVYTPFARAARSQKIAAPLDAPKKLSAPTQPISSLDVIDLNLLPKINWAGEISKTWTPGEDAAKERLNYFLGKRVQDYSDARDIPDEDGTSRMSPYLHFGEISVRRIHSSIKSRSKGAQKYVAELLWREFAYYLLFHFSFLPEQNLKKEFDRFPWRSSKKLLDAWKRGKTGYPIVDAGMRQLWNTGWMHNRVRMIVGSFLVKHLLLHWKEGADWFWDTLVDADLANNTMGWQWIGGCGPDAAPYFRIFNPILQSKKFDPDAEYIKKWVPELRKLPTALIHEPWQISEADEEKYSFKYGKNYPKPIVDHDEARKAALEAYKKIK